jgi:tetratricopeptide (TPR) repeat protein
MRLKRVDAYEREVAKAAETAKGFARASALQRLARAQERSGKLAEARRTFQKIIDQGESWDRGSAFGGAAWDALFIEPRPKDMLEQALQAVQLSRFDRSEALQTLACVYLELGKVDEAQQTFGQLLQVDKSRDLRGATPYVLGRLAEAYGMPDVARSAYASVEAEEAAANSAYQLAQRRLKVLDQPRR